MDENIILAGILWKFLRETGGVYLLGDDMLLLTTSVSLSEEEATLLREIASRKDFTWADAKEDDSNA